MIWRKEVRGEVRRVSGRVMGRQRGGQLADGLCDSPDASRCNECGIALDKKEDRQQSSGAKSAVQKDRAWMSVAGIGTVLARTWSC